MTNTTPPNTTPPNDPNKPQKKWWQETFLGVPRFISWIAVGGIGIYWLASGIVGMLTKSR